MNNKRLMAATVLAIIAGTGCSAGASERDAALQSLTKVPAEKPVSATLSVTSEQSRINQSENMQIDTQTVKRVKKSMTSGKKSNKFFKSLSDKITTNETPVILSEETETLSIGERKIALRSSAELSNLREGTLTGINPHVIASPIGHGNPAG